MNFINSSQLDLWAKQASREYLQDQTPLNAAIEKIAHEYSLNAEHIKRLSEMANIQTNLELFKQAQDKRIEFQQANHQELLSRLDATGQAKTASYDGHGGPMDHDGSVGVNAGDDDDIDLPSPSDDYSFPVGVRMGLFQADANDVEANQTKTAASLELNSIENMDPHQLMDMLDNTQQVVRELSHEQVKVAASLDACRDQLASDIHQAIFEGESTFPEMAAVGLAIFETPHEKNAAKEEMLKAGFALHVKDATLVTKQELSKLAYAIPEEYISTELDHPGIPVLVRNGRETTWSILDTLVKQRDRPASYDKALLLLNDDVKYVKRQLIG